MMALHVGLRRERQVASIVGYSGMLTGTATLVRDARTRPPVLLIHGSADPIVPVAALHAAKSGLERIGVAVETHISKGLGHSVDPAASISAPFIAKAFTLAEAQPDASADLPTSVYVRLVVSDIHESSFRPQPIPAGTMLATDRAELPVKHRPILKHISLSDSAAPFTTTSPSASRPVGAPQLHLLTPLVRQPPARRTPPHLDRRLQSHRPRDIAAGEDSLWTILVRPGSANSHPGLARDR